MEIVTGTIVAASKRAPAGLGLAAENAQEASFGGGTGKKKRAKPALLFAEAVIWP